MPLRIRVTVALAAMLALVASCSSPSATPLPTSGLDAPFGPSIVTAAIEKLAQAGVAVRVRPSEPPMVDVPSASRVSLLRFQVRNLALEANKGGGTLGSDLDAYSQAGGGPAISYLIAGWAQAADTPGSRAATQLLGDVATVEPERLTIPGLAIVMFLADLTGPAPSGVASAAVGLAGDPQTAVEGGDFCAQVATYLSSVLEGILDPGVSLEPAWLRDAIDLYGGTLSGDPQEIRSAVAAMALLVYATSISRPWVAFLVASPNAVHYRVSDAAEDDGGDDDLVEKGGLTDPETELRLSVASGGEALAEEAAECAELGDISLPEGEVEGSSVAWLVNGLAPHASDFEGDLELDEFRNAAMGYRIGTETREAHRNGTLRTAYPVVGVIVERGEIETLRDVVRGMLTGGDFGIAAPEVAAAFARLEPQLTDRLYPRATAMVEVTWHGEPDPTPPPSPRPEPPTRVPCADGCAGSNGDPHLLTVDQVPYDFQAAGEFVALRSADGAIEIQARQEPYEDFDNVTINTAVAMRIGEHRVGVYFDAEAGALRGTLDGADADAAAPTELDGGGRITPLPEGWRVDLPDGSFVWALGVGSYGINLVVDPSADLRNAGAGILGPVPEGSLGIPGMPDGSAVPATDDAHQRYEALYLRFADAWRVTDATSLFEYEPGTSTADFTILGFPNEEDLVGLDDLTEARRAAGEEACAGVSDPVLRAQCVFDVGITADRGFAENYRIVEAETLPAAGVMVRVVNVYDDGDGEVEALDVYGRSNEGDALLATVPFGEVSGWLDPGFTEFDGQRDTHVIVHRQGRMDALFKQTETLVAGDRATLIVATGPADSIAPDGGRSVWWSTIFEDHAEFPLRDPPPGQALLVVDGLGLRETRPDLAFLWAGVGDGCLMSPDADPTFPSPQPVGAGTQALLVVEPGSHTLTIHGDPGPGLIPECDDEPIADGMPLELAAGDRHLIVLFAQPDGELRTLSVPIEPSRSRPPAPATPPPASATDSVERTRAP